MRLCTTLKNVSIVVVLLCSSRVWSQDIVEVAPAEIQESGATSTQQTSAEPAVPVSELDTEQKLKIRLSFYGWLSGVKNDVTTRRTESTSDIPLSALLDALDFANFAHLQLQKGKWGAFSELDFIKLSEDAEFRNPRGIPFKIGADLVLKQTMFELGAIRSFEAKRVSLDALVGARYFRVDSDVNVGPFGTDITKDWLDPMIGARLRFKLSERWNASLRGDLAGFGVGSELTTNAVAVLSYNISDRYEVGFGYRYMKVELDKKRLDMDITTYGPVIGMAINF